MSRPVYSPEVIWELRRRVMDHNEACAPDARVKLGELKTIFGKGWRGAQPYAHALSKVDSYLSDLRKAEFDPSQHPRGAGGRFASGTRGSPREGAPPSTASLDALPASRRDHRELAQANAGYRAMTSSVVPETRFSASGQLIRDVGSIGTGIALAASLARGKPTGFAARLSRVAGREVGRAAAALPAAIVAGAANAARSRLRGARGTPLTREAAEAERAAISKYIRAAAGRGARAGEKLGDYAWRPPSWVARTIHEAIGRAGAPPALTHLFRAGATVGAGVPIGLAIRSHIAGSVFDPASIGSLVDGFRGYRRVQKGSPSLPLDVIEDGRDAMLAALRKGGDLDDLRKALPAGFYSKAGRALLTTLAGGAGAAAGAAAGGTASYVRRLKGKKGNPYHDAHGRFTSRSGASTLGAAAGGAALAATLAYAGLRAHNARMVQQSARTIIRSYRGAINALKSDYGEGARLEAHLRSERAFIARHIEADRGLQHVRAQQKELGAAAPFHYIARARAEANQKMAQTATFWDKFRLPNSVGWTTVGERRAAAASPHGRDAALFRDLTAFLGRATPQQFQEAIRDLSPEQRVAADAWLSSRGVIPERINEQLSAHHAAIDKAKKALETAEKTAESASAAELAAHAAHTAAPDEGKEAAAAAVTAAQVATEAATKGVAAAQRRLVTLEAKAPEVVSPVTGVRIAAPTATDHADVIESAQGRAARGARRAFDQEAERLRRGRAETLAERANRALGALAVLGERHGMGAAWHRAPARALATAHREVLEARSRLADATKLKTEADRAVREARSALKGASEGDKAHLEGRLRDAQTKSAAAAAEVSRIAGERATARGARSLAAHAYISAIEAPHRSFRLLPPHFRQEIASDLEQAFRRPRGALRDLLRRPAVRNAGAFGTRAGRSAKRLGADVAHQLFFAKDPATGQPQFSAGRALVNAGLIPGAAAGVADMARHAYARWFGNSQHQAKQPRHFVAERDVNPVTGAGYIALTLPHPNDRNDRVVLWGERYESGDKPGVRLAAGGRASALRQNFQQGRWNGVPNDHGEATGQLHSGSAHLMDREGTEWKKVGDAIDQKLRHLRGKGALVGADTSPGGPRLLYRKPDEQEGGAEAGQFINYMRRLYVDKEQLDQNGRLHALKGLFSRQGQILHPDQAYRLLTNTNVDGGRGGYRSSIFEQNPAFGTSDHDEISAALDGEVNRALALNLDSGQKANLQRAVRIVAIAKKLPEKTVESLMSRIQGGTPKWDGAASMKVLDGLRQAPPSPPQGWDKDELDNLARGRANQLRGSLGIGTTDDWTELVRVLASFAGASHHLSLSDAVDVATTAIRNEARAQAEEHGDRGRRILADAAKTGSWEIDTGLWDKLDAAAQARKRDARKGAPDAGDLWKFEPSEKRDGSGEWSSSSSGRSDAPFWAPHRAVPSVASNLGMQAGWALAGKYLPSAKGGGATARRAIQALAPAEGKGLRTVALRAAERFLPPIAAGASVGVRGVGLLAGATAGSAFLQSAAEAATRFGYRAAGKAAPSFKAPPLSAGEGTAQLAGNLAGGALGALGGAALGGRAGYLAGDALGSWLGGVGAERAYDWFQGYEPKHVRGVAHRFAA